MQESSDSEEEDRADRSSAEPEDLPASGSNRKAEREEKLRQMMDVEGKRSSNMLVSQ